MDSTPNASDPNLSVPIFAVSTQLDGSLKPPTAEENAVNKEAAVPFVQFGKKKKGRPAKNAGRIITSSLSELESNKLPEPSAPESTGSAIQVKKAAKRGRGGKAQTERNVSSVRYSLRVREKGNESDGISQGTNLGTTASGGINEAESMTANSAPSAPTHENESTFLTAAEPTATGQADVSLVKDTQLPVPHDDIFSFSMNEHPPSGFTFSYENGPTSFTLGDHGKDLTDSMGLLPGGQPTLIPYHQEVFPTMQSHGPASLSTVIYRDTTSLRDVTPNLATQTEDISVGSTPLEGQELGHANGNEKANGSVDDTGPDAYFHLTRPLPKTVVTESGMDVDTIRDEGVSMAPLLLQGNHRIDIRDEGVATAPSPLQDGHLCADQPLPTTPLTTSLDIVSDAKSIIAELGQSSLNIIPAIPTALKKEFDECVSNLSDAIQDLEKREHDLCAPAQRSILEIRDQLAAIDACLDFIESQTNRIAEIQHQIMKAEQEFKSNLNIKSLVARRKALEADCAKAQDDLVNLATPDTFHEYKAILVRVKDDLDGVISLLENAQSEATTVDRAKKIQTILKGRVSKSSGKHRVSAGDDSKSGEKRAISLKPHFRKKKKSDKTFLQQLVDSEDEFDEDQWGFDSQDMAQEKAWASLNLREQSQLTEGIRQAMFTYEKTGKLDDFPLSCRLALRHVQSLLPEECFYSRKIAIAIFRTASKNLVCRFHKRYQKVKMHDGVGVIQIQGVPHKPSYNSKDKKVSNPSDEYMHCGCLIDDVLLDFYFWKTLTISSPLERLKGVEEPMIDDMFKPRLRSFVIKLFKSATGLSVDDIYNPSRVRGYPAAIRENELLKTSVVRLLGLWNIRTGGSISFYDLEGHRDVLQDWQGNSTQAEHSTSGLLMDTD